MRHWLMKTEPGTFSIDDLERVRVEPWTGVRNYMARNHMRAMEVGDPVLIYHSSCEPPGVAGLARVARTGVVDETQFDPRSPYHEPRATRDAPVWDCVDVAFVERLPHYVALAELRAEPALADMLLLRRGMRLSVQPVTPTEYARIVAMGRRRAARAPAGRPPAVAPPRKASAIAAPRKAPAVAPPRKAPAAKRPRRAAR